MPRGRWTSLFVDALREHPLIEVSAVVQEHLGRPETRAERMASRRAAGAIADRGEAGRLYVSKPGRHGRDVKHLFLARPDAGGGHIGTSPAAPLRHAYGELSRDLLEAAADVAWVAHGFPASSLSEDEADAAAAAVRQVVTELSRLAGQLERRHRSADLVRAIELYESGLSLRKVSEIVAKSYTQVRRRLIRANVSLRPAAPPRGPRGDG